MEKCNQGMTNTVYNFSAGPAVLPREVLQQAQAELLSFNNIGMSIMEISHRSADFDRVIVGAKEGIQKLLNIPDNYQVLFLQGGATLQFSMIPINFLPKNQTADYIVTGSWGKKALKEAKREGNVETIYNAESTGFKSVPTQDELSFTEGAKYVHYTSNETIEGVEFKYDLDSNEIPLVCDMSSNILSKPIEISNYSLIYAGAQKNIGPSGVTLVIIRDDLLDLVPLDSHTLLDYRVIANKDSMLNTPNTWGIYIIDLVCKWIEESGGLSKMEERNEEKAAILYDVIDSSDGFYVGHAEKDARSLMNVTFNLPNEELEKKFAVEAAENNLSGLKGHRSVGGIRASIYNAFPREGVEKLVSFMDQFAKQNS